MDDLTKRMNELKEELAAKYLNGACTEAPTAELEQAAVELAAFTNIALMEMRAVKAA